VPSHGASSGSLTWQEIIDDKHVVCGIAWQNPGLLHEAHFHEPPEMFFILNGAGETLVGDHWTPLLPGDVVFNGSNVVHQTRAAIDTPLLCFYIFPQGPFRTFKYHFLASPSPDMPAPSDSLAVVHSLVGNHDRQKEALETLQERSISPHSVSRALQTLRSVSAENSHWKYGVCNSSLDSGAEEHFFMRSHEVWYTLSGSAEMMVVEAHDNTPQHENRLKTNSLTISQTKALYNPGDQVVELRRVSGNIVYAYFWAKSS